MSRSVVDKGIREAFRKLSGMSCDVTSDLRGEHEYKGRQALSGVGVKYSKLHQRITLRMPGYTVADVYTKLRKESTEHVSFSARGNNWKRIEEVLHEARRRRTYLRNAMIKIEDYFHGKVFEGGASLTDDGGAEVRVFLPRVGRVAIIKLALINDTAILIYNDEKYGHRETIMPVGASDEAVKFIMDQWLITEYKNGIKKIHGAIEGYVDYVIPFNELRRCWGDCIRAERFDLAVIKTETNIVEDTHDYSNLLLDVSKMNQEFKYYVFFDANFAIRG